LAAFPLPFLEVYIKRGNRKKVGAGDVMIIPMGIPPQTLIPPAKRVSFMVAKFVKQSAGASL